MSSLYSLFYAENISDLENKLKDNENELRRKDKIISEMEVQLEAAKVGYDWQLQIEEISL